MTLYEELKARGLVAQITDEEIIDLINNGKATFYIGFDCTADSLTAGHFLALTLMKRLQLAGNKPIALIGGGTTMIGDPSGRTDMRKMLTKDDIAHNAACFKKQMEKFIDFSEGKALMLNNADWLLDLNYVELLREVGKSGEERNRISRGLERRTKEKEAARKAVAQLLGKSPETVSAGEVQRYELWRQQDGKCAYYMLWRHAGGERAYGDAMPQGSIPPDWLADGVNAVQVDHILPRSRTFDNSFHNLCLCCHAANQAKGGRTPWEWLGAAQPQAWHDFEQWVQSLPLKGLKKRNYLLRDLNAEVQGRFHARNLTDSGYVAA